MSSSVNITSHGAVPSPDHEHDHEPDGEHEQTDDLEQAVTKSAEQEHVGACNHGEDGHKHC